MRSPLTTTLSLGLTVAGLMAIALPAEAFMNSRARTNPRSSDYEACASALVDSGIAAVEAADACADALYPKDLSRCVSRIDANTEIASNDALENCLKVRQPVDLAECVTDIDDIGSNVVGLDVLDYCRRSLLPARFAACVTGLSNGTQLGTNEALESCISAGNRLGDVLPSFIPAGEDPTVDPSYTPDATGESGDTYVSPEGSPVTPAPMTP